MRNWLIETCKAKHNWERLESQMMLSIHVNQASILNCTSFPANAKQEVEKQCWEIPFQNWSWPVSPVPICNIPHLQRFSYSEKADNPRGVATERMKLQKQQTNEIKQSLPALAVPTLHLPLLCNRLLGNKDSRFTFPGHFAGRLVSTPEIGFCWIDEYVQLPQQLLLQGLLVLILYALSVSVVGSWRLFNQQESLTANKPDFPNTAILLFLNRINL